MKSGILTLIAASSLASMLHAESVRVYFGTHANEGIFQSDLDLKTGALSDPHLAVKTDRPGFIEIHPSQKYLYATGSMPGENGKRGTGAVLAYAIDAESGKLKLLNRQPSGGSGPCHVSLDPRGEVVMVANYGGGNASSFAVKEDGSLAAPAGVIQHKGSSVNERRQKGPHAHSINPSPDGRYAFVADLGIDKVMIHGLDGKSRALKSAGFAKVAPGAGPRHLTFHPLGKFAYVINELDSTMTAFSWDAKRGKLTEIQTITTLPEGFEGGNSTAEVRAHPTGRFLYGSNRGHNSIVVYKVDPAKGTLTYVEHEPTQGDHPRNFNIDPTGNFLLVANRNSDNVVVLRIDQTSGVLEATGHKVSLESPVCVRFFMKETGDGWEKAFNGKTFEGWEGNWDWFRIEDGIIKAGNLDKKIPNNEFLASKEDFGDFELRFDAKLVGKGNNAGVQFWSQRIPNNHEMIGYQCDIGGWSKGIIWGRIYDESRRRKMLSKIDDVKLATVVNERDWNTIRLRAKGRHIQVWVNGVPTNDYTESDDGIPAKGRFGLQIHSGPPTECWYRNIWVRRL